MGIIRRLKALVAVLSLSGIASIQMAAQPPFRQGLVAYYSFDGSATDRSGAGYDGTVNGSLPTTNRFGFEASSYHFDGRNNYIELADIDLLGSYSISAWVNPSQYPAGNSVAIVDKYPIQSSSYGLLISSQGFLYAHTRNSGMVNSTLISDRNSIPTNQWTSVAFVFDSTQGIGKLFANGNLIKSGPMVGSIDNANRTRIGRSVWGGNAFSGDIDDVRIYNRALADGEVFDLYRMESDAPPRLALASAQVVNGFVVGVDLLDGGFRYVSAPAVRLIGGGGTGATALAVVENGLVVRVDITNPGTGYATAPRVNIEPPPFSPRLSIDVRRVRVMFSDLVVGLVYQVESSRELGIWASTGAPFMATDEGYFQEFDLDQTGRYFRVVTVP